MGRWLLKLAPDEYIEWSSVVDAPVSEVMDRDQAVEYSAATLRRPLSQYLEGVDIYAAAERRVACCDAAVTSIVDGPQYATVEDAIASNRAGENETHLSLAELRRQYAPDSASTRTQGTP